MGSMNSSRWGNTPTRICVESCFTLAPPVGKLRPGSWVVEWPAVPVRIAAWATEWPRGEAAASCALMRDGSREDQSFVMSLRHNWRGGGAQLVRLTATRPHFSRGGMRWWFLCPGCGARVGRLYLPGRGPAVREFKCRACHNLSYESAQTSRTKVRAMFLKLARDGQWTYRGARDAYREYIGGYIHAPRRPQFGPRSPAVGV